MSKKLPKTEWDKIAEQWHREVGEKGVWHQENDIDPVVFELLGKVGGKKILEIGAGNGYFARLLAKREAKVVATDVAPRLISFAREEERNNPLGVKYLARDAANLCGIKSDSFDVVVANMCLMDIADAERAVKETARVLKRNGRFFFSITHPFRNLHQHQHWTITKLKGKNYFARVIARYLSFSSGKFVFPIAGIKKIEATQYHRSINTYFKHLKNAGFLVSDFREIATKKPVIKADKEDGNITLRPLKYSKIPEKKMKELASKEIPLFLVIGAIKSK